MSDLLGLYGYNKSSGTEKLITVWTIAPRIYNSTTGSWDTQAVVLTDDVKAEFRTFLDYVFMVNGTDSNYSYNGTTWSTTTNLNESIVGTFIEVHNTRIYLGNITIAGTTYPSRVWYSDLPQSNGTLRWGLESGSDLAQTAASAIITSAGSTFKTNNIKVGDPVAITSGNNIGEYTVKSIDSETQLTLTEALTNTDDTNDFWVGSNYFDVGTDDGDSILGFGKNSSELLIFKRNSLFRYNSTGKELYQVKGAPGTTSRRSIVNLDKYTYYYYPGGSIFQYNGTTSTLISNAVEDIMDSVTAANQTEVVAWTEKQRYACFYIGDVTTRDGDDIDDCVLVYDATTGAWSTRSYPVQIKAATLWLESNIPNIYIGTEGGKVYKLDTGTDFAGDPISFQLETFPYFPQGPDTFVTFKRLRAYVSNGLDASILYKLYYTPTRYGNQWNIDEDWKPLGGSIRGDMAEFIFPKGSVAAGVALKFVESSTRESLLLERASIYYSNPTNY